MTSTTQKSTKHDRKISGALLALLPTVAFAQDRIIYVYDAAGNRVRREAAVSVHKAMARRQSVISEEPSQVGMSYNSQSGGYGFGITGLSAITRGGYDQFHDSRLAGVTYTASDNLFIDGKRLMLQSGDPGQDGAVYTVEGDPFTKVTVHGSYGDSALATWFEVTTGSDMTYQYGNSPDSLPDVPIQRRMTHGAILSGRQTPWARWSIGTLRWASHPV